MSLRLDHQFNSTNTVYFRYLYSKGEVDTPDRTVTPRRVLAKQQPQNVVGNYQRVFGSSLVNEFKVGLNLPETSATAFGTPGYDPVGVSLSGTVTSQSIDARGSTGIARSGLLIRATSASSTTGSIFDPRSLSFSNASTWSRGAHTVKFGGEYRTLQSDFQFLGSTEITYNSITDFIDNRPNAVAVALDSPKFKPQQYYLIGFAQDSWRIADKLTLELGLRYDFYSVVKEKDGQAKPFFIEENDFSSDPDNFYDADREQLLPSPLGGLRDQRRRRWCAPASASSTARDSSKTASSRSRTRSSGAASARRTSRTTGWRIRCRPISCATSCRFAATRTAGPTSTTSSTAPACRASCLERST